MGAHERQSRPADGDLEGPGEVPRSWVLWRKTEENHEKPIGNHFFVWNSMENRVFVGVFEGFSGFCGGFLGFWRVFVGVSRVLAGF